MPDISKDIILLIQYLAPGFLSAWIFYGLTSYARPNSFERVVQAVIYSLIINIIAPYIRQLIFFIGKYWSLGDWNQSGDLVLSTVIALMLGFILAISSNYDWFHKLLRTFHLSNRSAYPSEWHAVFKTKTTYMIFHLNDERRLLGYPLVWPNDYTNGHFYITNYSWLLDDASDDVANVDDQNSLSDGILIPSKDIKMIDILKTEDNHVTSTETTKKADTSTRELESTTQNT